MKKGINHWSFPQGRTVAECIALAKEAGYEGIELALSKTGDLSLGSTEQEIKQIKQVLTHTGMEIASLASGLGWEYQLTSSNVQNRNQAIEIITRQLDVAAQLEADTILVVPGVVNAEVTYDQAYDNAMEALAKLSKTAASYKVAIGVENVWNKFLLSPLEMKDFLDKINSSYVGAYFDVGNVLLTGYPEQWIKILNKRIKKVHLKDYRREAAGLAGFVDLLAGDVDYPAVTGALTEIGYNGYVIAEMIPPYTHYTEQILFNASRSMDAILGRTTGGK
ncbi:sugar phosphate isomerase/epimerase family protein [Paenibacillus sp. GCM10027628]|uniref:sugar phosphate isomerase/epimerase family protein n=1 Tax=Paenibacillus sp. GCM10027628 TaxID=3273413 RepID=UPI00362D06AF